MITTNLIISLLLILMAFVTTMIAPVTLKWSVEKTCLHEEKASSCRLWDESRRK